MHDLKESKVFLKLSICYAVKYKMWYNSSIKKTCKCIYNIIWKY